jgi:NAD(P)-dependent dehydrogenase (short-subunit alcohol dehydrogenase family)
VRFLSQAVGEVELDVKGGEASIDAAVGQAWDIFGTIDVLLYCSAVPGNLLLDVGTLCKSCEISCRCTNISFEHIL